MNEAIAIPEIRIFADFSQFTHRIIYPSDRQAFAGKYPGHNALIPDHLYQKLQERQREFEIAAFEDHFHDKAGAMLWISFDLEGIRIARMIKRHVGGRARVFYLKPAESPYHRYDACREIL